MTHRTLRIAFILIAVGSLWGSPIQSAEDPAGAPPIPKGYPSEAILKAAILTGQLKLINADNVTIPETVTEIKAIEYGKVGDRALNLDLYLPKPTEKPVPGLIFIHGGGWEKGNRQDMKFYTVDYANKGYVTATITYRLSGEAPFPAAVSDAKCAVRWMRANAARYNIDPDRIGVSGGSAGGHLALMLGYSADVPELEGDGGNAGVSSAVQAVANFYGPMDLTTPYARTKGSLHKFMDGKMYDEVPERYAQASPLTHLTPDDPPTLILHGTIDSLVPISQADRLAAKLKELGIPVVYDRFEGWPHTMDLAQVVNDRCRYRLDTFFAKYLAETK